MGYFNFKNGESAANDINLNAMQKGLIELVFPIGSTYITQSNTNPSTILKFGTWERLKGKLCLGIDEDDEDFKTIGNTGGEKTHTLTVNEIPAHTHNSPIDGGSTQGDKLTYNGFGTDSRNYVSTSSVGGGQPHNNMPPYEVVGYMWIRRA